jgi:hypothetical protein
MTLQPYLPGLILALAAWILTCAARPLSLRLAAPLGDRAPLAAELSPWAHSIGLPYLGLLLGWISSRDYGLTGHTPAEWIAGALAAVLLGLLLGWCSLRYSSARGWGDIRDEARWTLYRAATGPILGYLALAIAAGLLASLVEFALDRRWKGGGFSRSDWIPFLIRASGSAALFLLAHNFFLAMVYYLAAYVSIHPELYSHIVRIPARRPKPSANNQKEK